MNVSSVKTSTEIPSGCVLVLANGNVATGKFNHTYKNELQTDRKRALLYTALTRARFFLYCVDYEENIELREE